MKYTAIAIIALIAGFIIAADYTPVTEEATITSATITTLTATSIDASGAVEGATLGIEDGTADGYFQRTGTALEYVEGGVTNVLDANVGA